MRRTAALPATATREERFWAKVEWSEGCWAWLGARTAAGYGRFWAKPHFIAAHRMSYILGVGPIADGMQLDHLCRNPNCVNPAHLEPVTPRVNVLRAASGAGDRAARTHCPAGHPYDAANTYLAKSNQRHCRECQLARKRLPHVAAIANCGRWYVKRGRPCFCGSHKAAA